jgi:exonuclease III
MTDHVNIAAGQIIVDNDVDFVNRMVVDQIDDWTTKLGTGSLTCFSLNIRSIHKNWDELQIILQDVIGKFQILILTEVSTDINDYVLSYYAINGYNLYHKVREQKRGGGIFIYVQADIHVDVVQGCKFEHFEGINCMLSIHKQDELSFKIGVLAVYRPPHLNKLLFITEIEKFMLENVHENYIVAGDINLDTLKENDLTVQNYERVIASNGFSSCVIQPTREEILDGNLTSTCIDHILVRCKSLNINSVVVRMKLSDHYLTGVDIVMNANKCRDHVNGPPYKNPALLHEGYLKGALNKCKWEKLEEINDSQVLYDSILSEFKSC